METEVTDIDFAAKRVTARTKDGSTITQGYDKLILSTGSVPICPPVPGRARGRLARVRLSHTPSHPRFHARFCSPSALRSPRLANTNRGIKEAEEG